MRTMNAQSNEVNAKVSEIDGLSDIFRLLRMDVDIYHNAKVCGNWTINAHTLGATCFHMVTEGRCLLDVPGHYEGVLECGDLVIFPREIEHTMTPVGSQSGEQRHLSFKEAQDQNGTGMLCGEVLFQHRGHQDLLDALPAVFVINNDQNKPWLCSLLSLIIIESLEQGPANRVVLNKLSELLFTYAIRQYAHDNPENGGMLALYTDSRLSGAVTAFHRLPEFNWTLDKLAKEAALSRTVFSETFKLVSGWTVKQYITWWRMQLAWSKLSQGEGIANVAEQVGYQSEAAFSRAFQKNFGVTAGQVRRGLLNTIDKSTTD